MYHGTQLCFIERCGLRFSPYKDVSFSDFFFQGKPIHWTHIVTHVSNCSVHVPGKICAYLRWPGVLRILAARPYLSAQFIFLAWMCLILESFDVCRPIVMPTRCLSRFMLWNLGRAVRSPALRLQAPGAFFRSFRIAVDGAAHEYNWE